MSDETELMIGAVMVVRLQQLAQETHPRTGKKMRKAKIVSLIEQGGKKIQGPYGNWHDMPTKAEFKITCLGTEALKLKRRE